MPFLHSVPRAAPRRRSLLQRSLLALGSTLLLGGAASGVSAHLSTTPRAMRRAMPAVAAASHRSGAPTSRVPHRNDASVVLTDPPVAVGTANPGTSWDRSQCFAVSGGPGVAYECGDLRLARGLPTVRTFGEVRGMSMLYGSRFAAAMPILAARVTLPGGLGTPTRVTADLRVGAIGAAKVSRATGEWTGADFTAAVPRRIALTYEAASDPSGTYAYDIVVTFWNGGVAAGTYTNEGRFVLVNRSASPYGRGWWPSGIEQLIHLSNGDKAWIGADGSTRHYAWAGGGTTLWRADALDRPDSLTYDATNGRWTRWAEHRTQVQFDSLGQHVATVSRLGRVTTFSYGSVPFRLDSVSVPGLTTPLYQFDFSTAYVMNVRTPAPDAGPPRTTRIESNADGITRICDPDTVCATYRYAFEGGERHLVTAYDRGAVAEDFGYSYAHVLRAMTRDATGLAVARSFGTVGEARGLMVAGGVAGSTNANDHYTTASGPRAGQYDAAYLNRFGTPVRVGQSGYYYDVIQYDDARFPALATAVIKQNGFTTLATYDSRGNLDSVTAVNPHDDTRNAVTRYTWDGNWDDVTQIVGPETETTNIGIHPTTGVRLWQQDGRGDSTRVNFSYNANWQLEFIRGPNPADETHFTYDGLGNLEFSGSPLGGRTRIHNDRLGRVDTVYTDLNLASFFKPVRRRLRTIEYDAMDRPWRELSYGPPVDRGNDVNGTPSTSPATSVVTTNFYGAGGALESTTRLPSGGDVGALTTRYRYDALGRVTAVVSPDNQIDSTAYDKAGNDTLHVTRNGDVLRSTYDTLNRLVTSVVPAKSLTAHAARLCELSDCDQHPDSFPHFDLSPAGHLTFASETATFGYDPFSSQLTNANNTSSNVTRTYFPNGDLRTETQHLRTLSTGVIEPNVHDYTLRYRYDRSGHRLGLQVPDSVRPRSSANVALGNSEIQYTYRPDNGALSTITDLLWHESRVDYTARGERWQATLPGAVVTDTLDAEGRVVRSAARFGGGTQMRANTMTYDLQGKLTSMVGTAGPQITVRSWYSGLGQLVHSHSESLDGTWLNQNFLTDEYFDVSGLGDVGGSTMKTNYAFRAEGGLLYEGGASQSTSTKMRRYNPANDQMYRQYDSSRLDTLEYDVAGNTVFTRGINNAGGSTGGSTIEERASFHDASGRLRVTDTRQYPSQFARTFEESFYDALGRRVLVRTRRFCPQPDAAFDKYCRLSTVRRTIWDGSAELAEIQQPDTAADMEKDGALTTRQDAGAGDAYNPNPFFGTVVYTYGLYGTDRPVSVLRLNYVDWNIQSAPVAFDTLTITPLWNALGQMDLAVFPDGNRTRTIGSRAVKLQFPTAWFAYYRSRYLAQAWLGTLLEDKGDGSGLLYRRNRYYDPATGRFTQEDPIGLAGGMNLYGFAGGDPVNFSDPFGLCPSSAGGDGKTDQLNDCEAGTSGYYANKVSKGEDKILNTYLGLGATCGENGWCEGAAATLGVAGVGMIAGAGEALGLNQYLRAGVRTFRGEREFRIAGKLVDLVTGEERAHLTSTKVLRAIKSLIK